MKLSLSNLPFTKSYFIFSTDFRFSKFPEDKLSISMTSFPNSKRLLTNWQPMKAVYSFTNIRLFLKLIFFIILQKLRVVTKSFIFHKVNLHLNLLYEGTYNVCEIVLKYYNNSSLLFLNADNNFHHSRYMMEFFYN